MLTTVVVQTLNESKTRERRDSPPILLDPRPAPHSRRTPAAPARHASSHPPPTAAVSQAGRSSLPVSPNHKTQEPPSPESHRRTHNLIRTILPRSRPPEGKLYLYVAIDRTSKFTVIQLVNQTGRTSASAFLERVIEAVPYKIHTMLRDNGVQFTFPRRYANGPTARYMTQMFDMRCEENGIEHRLTNVKHP